jgi:hypothetical protein
MPDPVSGHGADPASRNGASLPEAHIAHATPNRVRLKVPAKRHDEAFFRTVEQLVAGWRNVQRVEVNPVTASILVHFSDPAALVHAAINGNNTLFQIVYPEQQEHGSAPPLLARLQGTAAAADSSLRQWTGGSIDLRTAILAAFLVGGLQQLVQGNVAAPAATLLWYAATVLGLPGAPIALPGQTSRGEPGAP